MYGSCPRAVHSTEQAEPYGRPWAVLLRSTDSLQATLGPETVDARVSPSGSHIFLSARFNLLRVPPVIGYAMLSIFRSPCIEWCWMEGRGCEICIASSGVNQYILISTVRIVEDLLADIGFCLGRTRTFLGYNRREAIRCDVTSPASATAPQFSSTLWRCVTQPYRVDSAPSPHVSQLVATAENRA